MHRYLIALGSNQRHVRFGPPASVLRQASDGLGLKILAQSRIMNSRPLGPSQRTYANAALLIETVMAPPNLLDHLKSLEAAFGRRAGGRRWQSRVLDLDIIGWSGGLWVSPELAIPHTEFRRRDFVLAPLAEIAPHWRDPITRLSVKQLKGRLDRRLFRA